VPSFHRQPPEHVSRADVLIVAAGKLGLIPCDWVKPGSIVIDARSKRRRRRSELI